MLVVSKSTHLVSLSFDFPKVWQTKQEHEKNQLVLVNKTNVSSYLSMT